MGRVHFKTKILLFPSRLLYKQNGTKMNYTCLTSHRVGVRQRLYIFISATVIIMKSYSVMLTISYGTVVLCLITVHCRLDCTLKFLCIVNWTMHRSNCTLKTVLYLKVLVLEILYIKYCIQKFADCTWKLLDIVESIINVMLRKRSVHESFIMAIIWPPYNNQ